MEFVSRDERVGSGSAAAGAGVAGLYEETVPLRAASMEKGRPVGAELKEGGSMRRKGEEEKRRPLERRPTLLCFGEPRLWEIGVAFVVAGTERERVLRFELEAGVDLKGVVKPEVRGMASTRLNAELLTGVPSKLFAFLDGEATMLGSTFSESKSSAYGLEVSNRRFWEGLAVGLPAGEKASCIVIAIVGKHVSY